MEFKVKKEEKKVPSVIVFVRKVLLTQLVDENDQPVLSKEIVDEILDEAISQYMQAEIDSLRQMYEDPGII